MLDTFLHLKELIKRWAVIILAYFYQDIDFKYATDCIGDNLAFSPWIMKIDVDVYFIYETLKNLNLKKRCFFQI